MADNTRYKFRAWDTEIKTMCYGNLLTDRWYSKTGFLDVSMGGLLEGMIIMQFTGLKDKNGKDIYEGDYDKDYQVVTWCEKRNGWALSMYDFPTKEFIFCNCYNCEGNFELGEEPIEIIGNIYENANLLPE